LEAANQPTKRTSPRLVLIATNRFQYSPGRQASHGIAIAYSYDGGASFTRPAPVDGTRGRGANGGSEGRLTRKLAVTGDTVVVVNSAKRPGESSRVWLVRGTPPVEHRPPQASRRGSPTDRRGG
jgi:hypothetical protein